MLTYKDIIKEEDNRLREKSKQVSLPLSEEDQETLELMNEYLVNGYDDKMVESCNIRPGVGLSAVQIGVLKRMFVILAYDEGEKLHHYGIINPKIIAHSEEKIYLPGGEGCLSVDRAVEGLVHRHRRIKVRTNLYDFKTKTISEEVLKLHDFIAIVFQHEYDHLNGVLFVDRIDKFNPLFVPDNSQPVVFNNNDEKEA
ncbi:MAG: peptide deformylase [Acholeplasmataceae bacterium]|nr:peptide deformylase [Acholeplasmataceae bacterium]